LDGFFAPQPLERLVFLRIFTPLAILGFLSLRMAHPGDWLSMEGFAIPDLNGPEWRQPLYLSPLPVWAAWMVCGILAVSALMLSAGFRTPWVAGIFAATLTYVTLADRMSAFTVNKLGSVLILALIFTPCGKSHGVDAWLDAKKGRLPPTHCTWGNIRFFQALLLVMYAMSGVAKWNGDWLGEPMLLWTHLHDSYQTAASYFAARHFPEGVWPVLRWVVLGFELLAPLWFILPWTRIPALFTGLGMHLFIGLFFGPVIWFSLLMSVLLFACFAPISWFAPFRAAQSAGGGIAGEGRPPSTQLSFGNVRRKIR